LSCAESLGKKLDCVVPRAPVTKGKDFLRKLLPTSESIFNTRHVNEAAQKKEDKFA